MLHFAETSHPKKTLAVYACTSTASHGAKENDCRNKTSGKARVRRRSNSKSPASLPTTLGDLPDKLLERILLRLASPVWFVRAAATCKRWRRIVTDNNFPFHMDRLLPNPVAGHYHSRRRPDGRSSLTFVPSSSAAALGVDARRHFSLDFLPGGRSSWELVDSSGSLLLLAATSSTRCRRRRCFFPDLVVCEPVTRRYKLIPRMAGMKYQRCLGVFLQGYTTSSSSIMSSYRVICVVYMEYNGVSDGLGTVRACVFDPNGSNSWKPRPRSACWYMVKPSWNMARRGIHLRGSEYAHFLGRAAGALFWAVGGDDTLLVLDKGRTEFEVLRLPDIVRGSELRAIVDGGNGENIDGKLRVVCLDEENVLRVFATWRGQYSNGEWVLQKSLRLAESTMGLARYNAGYFRSGAAMVVTAIAGSVVLAPVEEMTWMFSVDLETMEVAECKDVSMAVYPCELPWRPTLRACVTRCERRGQGRCSHICICDDA